MSANNDISDLQTDAYWVQIDKLYAVAEERNLLKAISRSDSEKFYAFTSMLRLANTLNKVKVQQKK